MELNCWNRLGFENGQVLIVPWFGWPSGGGSHWGSVDGSTRQVGMINVPRQRFGCQMASSDWMVASFAQLENPNFINFHPIWSRNGGFSISNQLETHIFLQANHLDMEHVPLQIRLNDLELKTQRTTDLSQYQLPTCLHWFRCRFSGLDLGWSRAGGAVWPRALGVSDPKWQIWDDLGWIYPL